MISAFDITFYPLRIKIFEKNVGPKSEEYKEFP